MAVKIANLVEKPADNESIMSKLKRLPEEERAEIIDQLVKEKYPGNPELGYKALAYDWSLWGRPDQLFPIMNDDWTTLSIIAGRGFGKLLNLKTLVFTSEGWKSSKDIEVGGKALAEVEDKFFDKKENFCNVTGSYEPEVPKKAYRLHFNDGSSVECGEEHYWFSWTHQNRKQYLRHYKAKYGKSADSFPEN